MTTAAFTHVGTHGYLTDARESHWQPALRPDTHRAVIAQADYGAGTSTASNSIDQTEAGGVTALEGSTFDEIRPSHALPAAEKEVKVEIASVLEQVHRSTSFPLPESNLASKPDQPNPWDFESTDRDATDLADLLTGTETELSLDEEEEGKNEDAPLYDKVPTEELIAGTHEVSMSERFEEGIPLLAGNNEVETAPAIELSEPGDAGFDLSATDDEHSFFSKLNQQAGTETDVPVLGRKSTTDVLDALEFTDRTSKDESLEFFQQLQQNPDSGEVGFVAEVNGAGGDDKWAAVLGDEDDFLIEDADDLLPDSEPTSPSSFMASLQQDEKALPVPEMQLHSQRESSAVDRNISYAPHQPSTSALTMPQAAGTAFSNSPSNVGLNRPGIAPLASFQARSQQPPISQRAESFADQAKGGYKSPYDLPLEISKTKRKPQVSRAVSQPQKGMPPPPPRTSSAIAGESLYSPYDSSKLSASATQSPAVQPLAAPSATTTSHGSTAVPQRATSSASFFEELPMSSRPRPQPIPARYTPTQPSLPEAPAQSPPAGLPTLNGQRIASAPIQTSMPTATDSYSQFQLRPPEKLDPYASSALQPPAVPLTVQSSRYSPAPGSVPGVPKPTPSPRYSPAPPSQAPSTTARYASQPAPPSASTTASANNNRYASQPSSALPPSASPALAHQPRTSSPLAYQHRAASEQASLMPPPSLPRPTSSMSSGLGSPPRTDSPSMPGISQQASSFPSQHPTGVSGPPEATPPPRSQTQSPGKQSGRRPAFPHMSQGSLDRPASAYGVMSPTKSATTYAPTRPAFSQIPSAAADITYVQPQDETAADPLERWKGAPIFKFGFGGQVAVSFPTRTPRYASGTARPQIKPGCGEVKVQKASSISPLSVGISSFPGPLRGKSKKKDVLTWLSSSITRLEAESPSFLGLAQTLPDPRKRHEEKLLLFKLIKILVEFDGHLDSNTEALKAINVILAPEVHAIDESTASQYSTADGTTGIYRPRGASARVEPLNPVAVESLRKDLLKGNREEAVWHAVDARLWSHALLIASTLEQKVWKQVVQEYVRQEVKTIGNNAESLAALYEIFGGNVVDSIDQLVPPSARAGLQMVSRVDAAGPIKNALDGLDKWKETLTLVLNNRCKEDHTALLTLARLLADYGRIEAAHCCLLFAKNPSFPVILGGLDDPQATAVLLGADQRAHPAELQNDDDALLLTEIYEFATCTLAGSSTAVPLPHLASYKLQKAKVLADNGYKTEAQAYCEAIAAGLKGTSKVSLYYHPVLLTELDDLSNRLKQVPVQSTSWMSKPSIEKVSGSIFSKFTNFVAGEDSDAASQTSGKDGHAAEIGPFANVSGSPNLSRSGSQSDIYGSYAATSAPTPTTVTGSRYAPNGILSNRSSSEFGRGRPSFDSQRSPPATSYGHDPKPSIYSPLGQSSQKQSPVRSMSAYQPLGTSPGQQFGTSPAFSNYQATPPQSSYMPNFASQTSSQIPEEQYTSSYEPAVPDEVLSYTPSVPHNHDGLSGQYGQATFGGYLPEQDSLPQQHSMPEQPTLAAEQPQTYGYEPPSDTGYVPYQPEPDSEDDGKKQKPKKKSLMEDDNDGYSQVPSATQFNAPSAPATDDTAARRKANDQAAEAAFKAAAEADAQRAKEAASAKRASGWFGGWLGGAKKGESNSLDAKSPASDQKIYQAKLGENKMKLYYDKDLKKWINPDDPDAGKSKGATPPPPRTSGGTPMPPMGGAGLPPRAGGSAPPPTLSRSSTPASSGGVGLGLPPSSSDGIAAMLPPSVNTSLGLANGAAPSPGGLSATPISAVSRPASSPANSAIDDLLGPPTGARKGPRGGKKAKGGRYVDVMAQ